MYKLYEEKKRNLLKVSFNFKNAIDIYSVIIDDFTRYVCTNNFIKNGTFILKTNMYCQWTSDLLTTTRCLKVLYIFCFFGRIFRYNLSGWRANSIFVKIVAY